jgi:hypothetical protein
LSRNRHGSKPLQLAIFRAPNLAAANVAMALLGAAWIPTWFFLNLYLQQVLGYGASEGGAALLPMTATIMVLMVGVTGKLVALAGFKRPLVGGVMVLAAGIGWLSLVRADGSFAVDVQIGSALRAAPSAAYLFCVDHMGSRHAA